MQVIDDPAEIVIAIQKFYEDSKKVAEDEEDTERQTGMYL